MKVLDSRFAGGGTHVNISGAAVAKFAPNKDEAVKLIAFMTSDAGAGAGWPTRNYEYPIRTGVGRRQRPRSSFGPIKPGQPAAGRDRQEPQDRERDRRPDRLRQLMQAGRFRREPPPS